MKFLKTTQVYQMYTYTMNELDDLLSFYQGRCLPDTAFTISKWASTNNLRQCVKIALTTARAGNKASIKTLRQIRERLLILENPLTQQQRAVPQQNSRR
ncbi:hypothetical protein GCM10028810_40120 [Spirosoma litoris]